MGTNKLEERAKKMRKIKEGRHDLADNDMGTDKLEKKTKKMRKIKERGHDLVDNGENSGIANFSKCNAKDDATRMNEDNVPAVHVKAHKSKKIRSSKTKSTPPSNEESNAVNNGEKYEPAVEDQSKGKKDVQSTEVSNGEETEQIIDGSKHKKDMSKRTRKSKTKDSLVLSEQKTVVNDGEEIQPDVKGFTRGKKDKSKRARKNKTKDALVSSEQRTVVNDGEEIQPDLKGFSIGKKGKSKKAQKQRKASHSIITEAKLVQEVQEVAMDDVYQISSGEDDDSKGMKKWIKEYHERRPGIKVLQEQIDDFITTYEEQEEQAKREKEASLAEDGWTVVVHRKGGKKTTDSESGVAVGSVAEAAVREKLANKKSKNVGLDFYRFQRKEAHRSEIMKLQSKFEEDKKRIQQLRAARKFRPY